MLRFCKLTNVYSSTLGTLLHTLTKICVLESRVRLHMSVCPFVCVCVCLRMFPSILYLPVTAVRVFEIFYVCMFHMRRRIHACDALRVCMCL